MYEVFLQRLKETGVVSAGQLQAALEKSQQRVAAAGLPSVVRKKRKVVAPAVEAAVEPQPAEAFSFSFF
jgi:hypothetical protein